MELIDQPMPQGSGQECGTIYHGSCLRSVPWLNCCSFGVPLGSMVLLRHAKRRGLLYGDATPQSQRFSTRYSFLYHDYCHKYFFWESVIMLRWAALSMHACMQL